MPDTQATTDEILLARFVSGDQTAVGVLAERYERALLGLALGLLDGRRDLARDAVQEAWLRVVRFAPSFRSQCAARTWLYRIVVNECHRLRAKRPPPAPQSVGDPAVLHRFDDVFRADATASLRAAVSRLPDERRSVILLCYHAGMTHDQAADILQIPLGTLKSRLHAALTTLRGSLPAEVHS